MNKYRKHGICLDADVSPHRQKKVSHEEALRLLCEYKTKILCNTYDFDCIEETSFWWVMKDRNCFQKVYSKKVSKYIMKANEKFIIGPISKERLIKQGYEVRRSSFKRYKNKDFNIESQDKFIEEVQNYGDNWIFYGCIDKDTDLLQAYSIIEIVDDVAFYRSSKANLSDFSSYYPMYGLYDKRDRDLVLSGIVKYGISGARTLSKHSEIQDFLINKLNYRKAYCKLQVEYSLILKLIVLLLYPFRKYISSFRVKALLNLEDIRRDMVKII